MKARRLAEVRQLVASSEFREWFDAVERARGEVARHRADRDGLLAQAEQASFRSEELQKQAFEHIERAGDLEDAAAGMLAESMDLENQGFELVARFEEQRFRASEAWAEAGAVERRMETAREALVAARAKAEAVEASRAGAELRRVERALVQAQAADERERATKDRLWDDAERHWARSMELSLRIAEHNVQGRRLRAEAEGLLRDGESLRAATEQLRAEADAAARALASAQATAGALVRGAAETFGATPGEGFIYFRQREEPKRAWCVALEADAQAYNVEVRPLAVYAVEARRGVDFLEPAVERRQTPEEADRRFETWFLEGREGRAREAGADEAREAAAASMVAAAGASGGRGGVSGGAKAR